jgi:hypothetical protein
LRKVFNFAPRAGWSWPPGFSSPLRANSCWKNWPLKHALWLGLGGHTYMYAFPYLRMYIHTYFGLLLASKVGFSQ